jgi:hypothetical protein
MSNKMNDNYVKELIQVAAVALAAAQTFMYGNSSMESSEDQSRVSKLLSDVYAERESQEAKWGTRYELDSPPEHWLTIMGEEVGEVADEIIARGIWGAQRREGEKEYMYRATMFGWHARNILERK